MNSDSPRLSIVYLGPEASFTHLAAQAYFGPSQSFLSATPDRVCRAVRTSKLGEDVVNYGILPIENNSAGFVDTTLNAIYGTGELQVIDEIYMPIRLQLLSRAKSLRDIKVIYSHPQPFGQSKYTLQRFVREGKLKYERIDVSSTSRAAIMAATDPHAAAISSAEAAALYDVPIIEPDIHDRPDNTTRFWVFGMGSPPVPTGNDRSVFLIEILHEKGTLFKLFECFASHDINILSIQSRPIASVKRGGQWEYAFFVETEGHVRDDSLSEVYAILGSPRNPILRRRRAARLIGSYPNRYEVFRRQGANGIAVTMTGPDHAGD